MSSAGPLQPDGADFVRRLRGPCQPDDADAQPTAPAKNGAGLNPTPLQAIRVL